MLKISKCKALARQALLGKYGLVIGARILAFILCVIFILLCVGSFVLAGFGGNIFGGGRNDVLLVVGAILFAIFLIFTILFFIFFSFGLTKLCLNICRGAKYGIGDIWYPFKKGAHPWRIVGVEILKAIIQGFISLLIVAACLFYKNLSGFSSIHFHVIFFVVILFLVILLLNVTASLYLSRFIILDHPELGILGALQRSADLMKGHKLKGIWLMIFSFLFWNILIGFCRLSVFWVGPYNTATQIFFYMSLDGTMTNASMSGILIAPTKEKDLEEAESEDTREENTLPPEADEHGEKDSIPALTLEETSDSHDSSDSSDLPTSLDGEDI